MIKLITFDLDDTLWDNSPVIRRAVQKVYEWLFNRCPELLQHHDAASLDAMKNRLREEDPELAHRVSEVRVTGMQKALEGVGYAQQEARAIAEQAFGVFHYWRHQVDLFEGVEEVLKALSSRYSLAVITNGNADVNQLGLGQYFRFTVSAEDLNRSKPDPEVFLKALSLAGVPSKNVIHVGDNLITDVQGAAEVGMRTIWFNPGKIMCENTPVQPDVVISSLPKLPDAVKMVE